MPITDYLQYSHSSLFPGPHPNSISPALPGVPQSHLSPEETFLLHCCSLWASPPPPVGAGALQITTYARFDEQAIHIMSSPLHKRQPYLWNQTVGPSQRLQFPLYAKAMGDVGCRLCTVPRLLHLPHWGPLTCLWCQGLSPKVIGPKLGTIMNGFCAPNMSHPDVCCPALYLLLDSRNFPFSSRLEPELSTGVVSVQFALTSSTFSVAITAATL